MGLPNLASVGRGSRVDQLCLAMRDICVSCLFCFVFFWLSWVLVAAPSLSRSVACRILVPQPGIESVSPALQDRFFFFFFFQVYIQYKHFINSRSSWWAKASTQTSSTQSQVQRSLRASRSDSNRVSTSPSRTGPFTFRMMERLVSSMNSTRTYGAHRRDGKKSESVENRIRGISG